MNDKENMSCPENDNSPEIKDSEQVENTQESKDSEQVENTQESKDSEQAENSREFNDSEQMENTPVDDTAEEPAIEMESDANSDEPIIENLDEKQISKNKKDKNVAVNAACILSACSILLLIALSISLLVGLIPLDGNRVVYLQVANGNSSIVSGDVDPNTLEDFMNSVTIIDATTPGGSSIGTGIVLSADGYIATNYHVVEDSTAIDVFFYDSQSTPVSAELVGYSEIDDIAVLKVNKKGLRAATFASSAKSRIGERVYAVGTPEGVEFGWSVTQGILSSNNREIRLYDNEGILEKKMYVLQTDASVNPGNSGGPLINASGQVLGIITLKLSASVGMGFAIPSDGALEIIEAIIKFGNADSVNSAVTKGRPLIGITGVGVEGNKWYTSFTQGNNSGIREVEEAYAKQYPDLCFFAAVDGVYVSGLTDGLDAANHLKVGDIITVVCGEDVDDIYDVMDIINDLDGGDKISVKFFRNGEYSTAEITLGTQK